MHDGVVPGDNTLHNRGLSSEAVRMRKNLIDQLIKNQLSIVLNEIEKLELNDACMGHKT